MDALIKLPEPERKELIERASKGEKVSARAASEGPSREFPVQGIDSKPALC